MKTPNEATNLRRSAMDYLARREHSRFELHNKLQKKYPETKADLLDEVLDKLTADKLLSDDRFAAAYVRYRKSKGYGPLYIKHHLKHCRVAPETISKHLQHDDPDWENLLQILVQKKLSGTLPQRGSKAHQKAQRFILSRGFSMEQMVKLWR